MNQEDQASQSKKSSIGIRMLWDPGILGLSPIADFRIFNVYSEKDYANRFLYPLGAIFNLLFPVACYGGYRLMRERSSVEYPVSLLRGSFIDSSLSSPAARMGLVSKAQTKVKAIATIFCGVGCGHTLGLM